MTDGSDIIILKFPPDHYCSVQRKKTINSQNLLRQKMRGGFAGLQAAGGLDFPGRFLVCMKVLESVLGRLAGSPKMRSQAPNGGCDRNHNRGQ